MDDGDSILVKIDVDELIHLDIEGFQGRMDETIDGGFMSGWTVEVEGVEGDWTLVLRINGNIERCQ